MHSVVKTAGGKAVVKADKTELRLVDLWAFWMAVQWAGWWVCETAVLLDVWSAAWRVAKSVFLRAVRSVGASAVWRVDQWGDA